MAEDKRRRFGNIRKRGSGRYQARYLGPDGLERNAPYTFAKESQAERWLTLIEADILKGEWEPPEGSEIKVGEYGAKWIRERKLQQTSREGYENLLRLYIQPYLGKLGLGAIKPSTIRTWRTKLLADGCTEPQAAKSYALLRAIFSTAVKPDKLVRENPCQIEGYDRWDIQERTPATIGQAIALAEHMPQRYRAFITTAAFSSLRWGELVALRRCDVDLDKAVIRVPRRVAVVRGGLDVGSPKSEAGKRAVAVPPIVVKALRRHMEEFTDGGSQALIFTGDKGAMLRAANFIRAVKWRQTCIELDLPPGFRFHDLRHTGNDVAASSGASTRELMHRMGHSTMRAALIYQHRNSERDQEIAKAMHKRIKAHGKKKDKKIKKGKSIDKDESSGP